MAKVEVVIKDEKEEVARNPMVEAARKMLLAGIGAAALAREEMEDLASRLVERGELAEKDGKRLIRDLLERRQHQVHRVVQSRKKDAEKAEDRLESQVEKTLARINVPTKSDIETLNATITALTERLDELKKAQSSSS